MATQALSYGYPQTLVAGTTYAMPTKAAYIFAQGGTIEVSNDGTTWAAIGAQNPVAASFIRSTGTPSIVSLRQA